MERYLVIDCGKFGTKIAEYDADTKEVKKSAFRTNISEGDFRADEFDAGTCIIEIDGSIYKVGNDAIHVAAMKTTKQDDHHRICTLTAIARICSESETDELNIAVLLPATEWANPEKKEQFKNFILPEEGKKVSVKIKTNPNGEATNKTFVIKKKFAYAESAGALWVDDAPEPTNSSDIGVIDIGKLNANLTMWHGTSFIENMSTTTEDGGGILISSISQTLSTRFSRVNERDVAYLLKQEKENRCLVPMNGNKKIIEESREIITNKIKEHVNQVKSACDAMKWSIGYMSILAIGGTSHLLADELFETFGEGLILLNDPEYVNVLGALRWLISKTKGEYIELTNNSTTTSEDAAA